MESPAETKTCTKCGVVKPLDAFYKRTGKRQRRDGIRPRVATCKRCMMDCSNAHHTPKASTVARDKRIAEEQRTGLKFCTVCEQTKPIDEFRPQARICVACTNAKNRAKRVPTRNGRIEMAARVAEEERAGRKTCVTCETEKPLEEFTREWYIRKDGFRKRRKSCVACVNAARTANRKPTKKERLLAHEDEAQTRVCSECNKEKPFGDYYCKKQPDGARRPSMRICKKCICDASRAAYIPGTSYKLKRHEMDEETRRKQREMVRQRAGFVPSRGLVYCLYNPTDPGVYKVGRSVNLKKRLLDINRYSRIDWDVVALRESDDHVHCESLWHDALNDVRISPKKELFRMTKDQVAHFVDPQTNGPMGLLVERDGQAVMTGQLFLT